MTEQRKMDTEHGIDHYDLACHPRKMTAYISRHLYGAFESLSKATSSVPLPEHSEESQRSAWEESRDEMVTTFAEALESLSHVLVAMGCTDKELQLRYAEASLCEEPEQAACEVRAESAEEETPEPEEGDGEDGEGESLNVKGKPDAPLGRPIPLCEVEHDDEPDDADQEK